VLLLLPLALIAAPTTPPAAPAEQTVAVLELRPATPAAADDAKLESAALVDAVRATQSGKVLSLDDVRALLEVKAAQQLMGCDDPRCATDISNALAADLIVSGTAGNLGGARHVFVSILDGKKGRVIGRASQSFTDGDLKAAMKRVATVAFSADGAENGDQALTELRTAVVVDELDPTGKPVALGRVGACLQGDLVKRGVPVVSAEQVKRIRQQLDPQKPLAGQAIDALDAGVVDVILSSSVRYSAAGSYHTNTMMRASLSYELVKVDTGEVLAAGNTSFIERAPSAEGAMEQGGDKACAAVQPDLAKALDLRIERGNRVVVNVAGGAPEKALAALDAVKPLVARTKLRKVDAKTGAVVDVTLRGGDGIALALALGKAGQGAKVTSASAGALSWKD
jgi:hypothetical protein